MAAVLERVETQPTAPVATGKCETHCGGKCNNPFMQRALDEILEGMSSGSRDVQAEIASFIKKSPKGDYFCLESGFNGEPSRYPQERWYEGMWQAQSKCPGYKAESTKVKPNGV